MRRRRGTGVLFVGVPLLVVGLVGMLLPVLTTPVMSDSMYHYLLAPVRFHSLWDTVPYAIQDMDWRLRSGRITPVGVWYQHVSYDLVMRLCLRLGVETWIGEAVVKVLLIGGSVGAFHLLVGNLRDRVGRAPLPARRRLATVLFATFLVAGATTTSPVRNGWTTFVQLCIGGVVILFGIGALCLWVTNRWGDWSTGVKAIAGSGLVLTGVALVLSYELHWAAYPFVMLLVLGQGWSGWRSVGPRTHRAGWVVLGWFSAGFVPTLVVTRLLIARYATRDYPGLALALDGSFPDVLARQLVSSLPGTGLGVVRDYVARLPDATEPQPLGGAGWVWGLLAAVGLVLVVRDLHRTEKQDRAEQPGGNDSVSQGGVLWGPWVVLASASVVAAIVGAAVLSVSEQSRSIVAMVGDTYRGTPWIVAGISAALAALLAPLMGGRARWSAAWTAAPVAVVLFVGAVVWPYNAAVARTTRLLPDNRISMEMARQTVLGPGGPASADLRCTIDEDMPRNKFHELAALAYRGIWHEEFCPTP